MSNNLTEQQIKALCLVYATTRITQKMLALEFNCSPNKISKIIHKAIIMRNN